MCAVVGPHPPHRSVLDRGRQRGGHRQGEITPAAFNVCVATRWLPVGLECHLLRDVDLYCMPRDACSDAAASHVAAPCGKTMCRPEPLPAAAVDLCWCLLHDRRGRTCRGVMMAVRLEGGCPHG